MPSAKPRVLVIIPAYNEEKTIHDVLLRLRRAAPDLERVVVNDGSRDATTQIVAGLGEKQLKLACNLGYGRALQTGLKYALERDYQVVVCLDADGQHRPEDLPGLLDALLSGHSDVVIGSRYCEAATYPASVSRRWGQLLFSHLSRWLVGRRIYDTTSGFKALRASACKALVDAPFWDFHIEMIVRLSFQGFRVSEFPITVNERLHGRSMHSFKSIIEYPLKTLLMTLVAALDVFLARRSR
jgi:glycosyltransferase involved in cell wall biosynthesis